MKRIYLDYAATTPLDPAVKKAMELYFSEKFGNPGSLHWFGQEASAAVFEARRKIASAVGVNYKNIIFTGSATEANNLVLRGVVAGIRKQELGSREKKKSIIHNSKFMIPKVIVSAIEHESILTTAKDLDGEGVEVVVIPVNKDGMVDLKKLEAALDERTVLVSIMYANNEVGTIQPIQEISKIIKNFRKDILFHTDAVQAFQYLNCNLSELGVDPVRNKTTKSSAPEVISNGVDLMTLSAHKIYGPKGVGALCVNNESRIVNHGSGKGNKKSIIPNSYFMLPVITGGGQEWGIRSGTENVPSIVGFGKATELVLGSRNQELGRIKKLTDYLWTGIKKIYPKAILNGSARLTTSGSEWDRLPNNLNVYFPDKKAEELLIALDLAGVAVSAGAACSARSLEPSYVLEAMGFGHERCNDSLRFTLGRPTTKTEIDKTLKILKNILQK